MRPISEAHQKKEKTYQVISGGGVTSAAGFKAAALHAGFYPDPEKLDLALVVSDEPCAAAATFTQNVFCAAPVLVSQEHLDGQRCGTAQAIIINSGNANAATGDRGLDAARQTADIVATTLGCTSSEVLIASTGVIGQFMNTVLFEQAVPNIAAKLSNGGGNSAACAIMTTDTIAKEHAITYESKAPGFEGTKITIGGMSKGSGMIMPDMATMIAVITTDAPILPPDLRVALKRAVDSSFNKLTVDTDTSTNDCCFALASGKAGCGNLEQGTEAFEEFCQALQEVCTTLARIMAKDGEGATRLITVNVYGAANDEDADKAARAVANSPLVKTAVFGHDANWGRVAMALGKSGASFDQHKTSIDIMGIPVCRDGLAVDFSEEEALKRFDDLEITIDADLGAGSAEATIWTCDYSHDYITINGDYRT